MRLITLATSLIVLQVSSAGAGEAPWAARTTDFGLTALGNIDVAPGSPATKWNILSVGLFCGAPKAAPPLRPGRIYFYLYGIDADRSATANPLDATVTIDGTPTDLKFGFVNDVAVTEVPADFVRRPMNARGASVLVKDYNSPDPDVVVMDGATKAIRSALQRACGERRKRANSAWQVAPTHIRLAARKDANMTIRACRFGFLAIVGHVGKPRPKRSRPRNLRLGSRVWPGARLRPGPPFPRSRRRGLIKFRLTSGP